MCIFSIKDSFAIDVVTESLPPYQYQQEGIIKGSAYYQVEKLLECSQLKGNYIFLPWNRAYDFALNNNNTLIFSMAKLKNREDKFVWLKVIGHTDDYIFKLKSRKDIKITTLSDLSKWRLGLQKDDFIDDMLKKKAKPLNLNIVYYQTHVQKLKMLLNNRFDLMEEESDVYGFKLKNKEFGYEKLEKLIPLTSPIPFYVAINKNSNRELISRLKRCTDNTKE